MNDPAGQSDPTNAGSVVPTNTLLNATETNRPVGGVHLFKDEELPYRFRQSTFEGFKDAIAQAIREPNGVVVNPAPIRATTYAARCRDAIIAKKRYNWPSTFTTFQLEQADLVVRHNETTVMIGPRKINKGRIGGEVAAIANPDSLKVAGIPINRELHFDELHALAVVLASKLVAGPFILNYTLDEKLASELEANHDIAIQNNSKGETIIV